MLVDIIVLQKNKEAQLGGIDAVEESRRPLIQKKQATNQTKTKSQLLVITRFTMSEAMWKLKLQW